MRGWTGYEGLKVATILVILKRLKLGKLSAITSTR